MLALTLHLAAFAEHSMMLPATHADAFTTVPYAGNPACVVLLPPGKKASDSWMLKVANEMHLSETAFLEPMGPNTFGLRWFTPTDEVDLCGHATLATAHVLWMEHGFDPTAPLEFHTRSGKLVATRDDAGFIELDFPTAPAEAVAADADDRAQLLSAFPNLTPEDVLYVGRNRIGGPGGGDVLVEVTPAAFATLEVVPSEVKKVVCRVLSVAAVGCPVAPEPGSDASEYAFSSRGFAPCVGVDEDPVRSVALRRWLRVTA